MSLVKPQATVTLGGRDLTSPEAGLVRARARLDRGGAHDTIELAFWGNSKLAAASPDDDLALQLGSAEDQTGVWSGKVASVVVAHDGGVIVGHAPTLALSKKRVSKAYLSESISDIVNDLASDIDIDQVDGDTTLEAYFVDDRRSVWSHLGDLARIAGADLGCSAEGGLRFTAIRSASADARLRFGADLLHYRFASAVARDAPAVAAYGSASENGSDKWHWIQRTPGGDSSPQLVVAALKTRDAADAMGQALGDAATRTATRGTLVVRGNAAIRPSNILEISDLPAGDPGQLRVLAVDHILDAREGFVTTLTCEAAP